MLSKRHGEGGKSKSKGANKSFVCSLLFRPEQVRTSGRAHAGPSHNNTSLLPLRAAAPHMEVSWTSRFPRQRSSGPSPARRLRTRSPPPQSTAWPRDGMFFCLFFFNLTSQQNLPMLAWQLSVPPTCARLPFSSWPSPWWGWGSAPAPAACSEEWWIGTVGTEGPRYGKRWRRRPPKNCLLSDCYSPISELMLGRCSMVGTSARVCSSAAYAVQGSWMKPLESHSECSFLVHKCNASHCRVGWPHGNCGK